ncbi:hypothetical protein MNBD_NITROSPINAE02-2009 [hydrothermal vent metagenome]|uniref:Uncharacterized protein n=1 Tax=hydrothermal vent metagenome TaxID=652676 RepID=A0A3B1CZ48_9ZZZZ
MVRLILFAALAFVVAMLLINGFYLRRDAKDSDDPFTIDVEARDENEEDKNRKAK